MDKVKTAYSEYLADIKDKVDPSFAFRKAVFVHKLTPEQKKKLQHLINHGH